ncbi:hypothetical protein [Haloferula sp. BvORR071]|uniref:hypothetical protein n=1 Tax=Haloferula sp. BvORR071 TaxID=1396141 RepID=UPI0005552405|nr:hypothetical protein [Haloferula sp. BvORR071]
MKSRLLALLLLLVALAAIAFPLYWSVKLEKEWNAWEAPPQNPTGQSKLAKLAQLGDAFGPFNTAFAMLAFVTAMGTLWGQHKDAKEAEELRRKDADQRTKDKEHEDKRHAGLVAAQTRVAKVSGYTSLLNFELSRLEDVSEELAFLQLLRNRCVTFGNKWRESENHESRANANSVFVDGPKHLTPESYDEIVNLYKTAADLAARTWLALRKREDNREELETDTRKAFKKLCGHLDETLKQAKERRNSLSEGMQDLRQKLELELKLE